MSAVAGSCGAELGPVLSFLQDLIRIRSLCGVDGEKAVADRILQEANALGLPCRMVAKDAERPNVIVSTSVEGPTLFCFVAHIDTVDIGESGAWKHGDPFAACIEGDRLYGRGACDCKGGVAVSMYALKRLQVCSGLFSRLAATQVLSKHPECAWLYVLTRTGIFAVRFQGPCELAVCGGRGERSM